MVVGVKLGTNFSRRLRSSFSDSRGYHRKRSCEHICKANVKHWVYCMITTPEKETLCCFTLVVKWKTVQMMKTTPSERKTFLQVTQFHRLSGQQVDWNNIRSSPGNILLCWLVSLRRERYHRKESFPISQPQSLSDKKGSHEGDGRATPFLSTSTKRCMPDRKCDSLHKLRKIHFIKSC